MKTKLLVFSAIITTFIVGSAIAQYDPRAPAGTSTSNVTGGSKKEPTGSRVVGFNGIEKATPISKEEAMAKYPPRGKTWPTAEITSGPEDNVSTTVVPSPYPPHHRFDVSAIPRGGLVLDPYAKHVFIRP